MLRKSILVLPLAGILLFSCDQKERAQLQSQVDSLRTELALSQETAMVLEEVGVMIDSIDANRDVLRSDIIEGTQYTDFKDRLSSINDYLKSTKSKIVSLEQEMSKANKSASRYATTVKRLKADLEERVQQLAALETEVAKLHDENQQLAMNVSQKDSLIITKEETIRMREQDVATLETQVTEIHTAANQKEADLYYAQAQALEVAADRTKFAPKKKKETQREALELYRLSQSLGKEEAESRIVELEKVVG